MSKVEQAVGIWKEHHEVLCKFQKLWKGFSVRQKDEFMKKTENLFTKKTIRKSNVLE